ncbi:hypothetical protein DM01DRAFT_1139142 [Hesseltinella vesiculosa]|uniref:Uncharacterized protein n=1 Tax=Hesseltinella vesiculosa TaxID=101127 RepID=A0A1X2G805_9FUNG|nr:hypothetical protein DM01DRAFT_1139142 [Hesseltinella vesiculosa]
MTHGGIENYLSDGAIKLRGQLVEQQSSKAIPKFDKEDTEEDAMLLMVEQVVRNFDRHQESDSEATCYRRFAPLLDILLDGTGIIMVDSEKASIAT